MADPDYELFAIRYATRDAQRSEHFIGGDPHDGPMPMDYFVWLARGGGRSFVIDTGFNAEVARQRRRNFLRCPVETLAAFDIDPADVGDVILTHLHYDHVGNFDRFPNARFHLQERELAYATGRYMQYPRLSHSFEVEDVCGIVRLNYARRVLFYDGDAEIAPGLTVHVAGGHSGRSSIRPRQHTPRPCRARLRRQSFLREHDQRASVHDGVSCRRHACRLRQAARRGA
ncbi:glyoxylase-like metal-dependent hydrolase (beta-lactamase superfamily II) [Bradyrhizobium ottawaense]